MNRVLGVDPGNGSSQSMVILAIRRIGVKLEDYEGEIIAGFFAWWKIQACRASGGVLQDSNSIEYLTF